jgi:hypothetical protein
MIMSDQLELLLEKAVEAMRRDINQIFTASSGRKLNATEARDLVAYLKLLHDIADRQDDKGKELASTSEEELKELAESLLHTSK